jgi:trans-aconitate 2-methyltransferase
VTFEGERTRPVRDLMSAVTNQAVRVAVDLGCGPGNSTQVLAARFPEAEIIGLDSSSDMIEAARKRLPRLRFEIGAVEDWDPLTAPDVILSNAVLQWIPDHAALLPRLLSTLAPGGTLAVQLPDNLGEPSQALMRDVAVSGPWAEKLAEAASARTPIESPDWYYSLLRPHCAEVNIWRTTYYHALAGGAEAIVEWFKSTGLRPFLAPLDEHEQATYLANYREAVAHAYPALPDGFVLLPFPRLFIVATR